MTTTCPACGVPAVAGAVYCHRCGRALGDSASTEAGGVAPTAPGAAPGVFPSPSSSPSVPSSVADPEAAVAQQAAGPDAGEEQVLWEGSFSAKAAPGLWLTAALITIGALVLGLQVGLDEGLFLGLLAAVIALGGTALYVMYGKLSVHYRLTSRRFIRQAGLIRRVSDCIEVIDLDDVAFSQGPFERLVGVGTIKIMSSDVAHPELFLDGIDRVAEVARLIDEARRAERRRRGLFIEVI